MRWLFFLGVLGLAVGCGSEPAFQCQSNNQCGVGGLCEDNGYCTFEDPDCPSGRRYGSLASDGLAGTCIGVEGDGTSDGTTTNSADGSGSESGTSADGPGSDESGEIAECGAGPGSLCQPAPPEGWSGPVLAVTGSGSAEAPACPGATSQVLAANADLSADPASCTCDCAASSDDCGVADIIVQEEAGPNGCNGPDGTGLGLQVAAGTCETPPFAFADGLPLYMYATLVGDVEGQGCQPQESFELPEPTWGTALAGCEAEAPAAGSCDDEATCLPAPDLGQGTAACIYRDGDMTCPLGGYTEQFTFFRSVDDARACNPCSCNGTVGFQQCELRVYADAMCAADFVLGTLLSPDITSCEPVQASWLGAFELVSADMQQCQPSGGAPLGEANPSEPITVCCAS